MSELSSTHRATRRNLATQPIPRGNMGGPRTGPRFKHTPISADELAYIIDRAGGQRDAEDDAADQRRKTA